MKTMRKGAIVKYIGEDEDLLKVWGEYYKVYQKEGVFLRLVSLSKPEFGVCATIPCKNCQLVNQ